MAADILDQLAEDIKADSQLAPAGVTNPAGVTDGAGSSTQRQAIKKVNYSHDGMINLLIANRGISQNAIAAHFGYTASWVSQVMSSDAFQAKLAERAQEIEDPTLRATVEEGLKGILARSMELLKEKLAADKPPDNLVLRSLELSSRALGYGAREHTVAVNVNLETHLEQQASRLTSLLQREKARVVSELPTDLRSAASGTSVLPSSEPKLLEQQV